MVTVAVDTPFDLELGSAPGTGYMWELLPPPQGVRLLATRFEQKPAAQPGDGGTQVFTCQAHSPGRLALHFVLKRRWEQASVQERVIEVDVR
jgi:predicted secreted protein